VPTTTTDPTSTTTVLPYEGRVVDVVVSDVFKNEVFYISGFSNQVYFHMPECCLYCLLCVKTMYIYIHIYMHICIYVPPNIQTRDRLLGIIFAGSGRRHLTLTNRVTRAIIGPGADYRCVSTNPIICTSIHAYSLSTLRNVMLLLM
jgi:hypothetical protein